MPLKNIWGKDKNENFFRRKINIDKKPEKAYARIYVDTGYELYINERFVSAADEWCNTRDYEVSEFLTEGTNIIAVHALNHAGHRGFAFELAFGGKSILTSDGSWVTFPKERWGWYLNDFDDAAWEKARVLDMSAAGEPQWQSLPGSEADRVIPPLDCSQFFRGDIPKTCSSPYYGRQKAEYRHSESVLKLLGDEYREYISSPTLPRVCTDCAVVSVSGTENTNPVLIKNTLRYTGPSFVIDFKCEVSGYFRMKINSEKSVSFRLYYGETLSEAMSEPSRDICQNRMLREEYRVFGGETEFESRMRVAFRYVRVEFFDCEAEAEAGGFSVRTRLYPVAKRGYFSCSDADMNKVWRMGEKTLHLCMQEYYLDAPKRDRFLWTGDARLEALINYHTFADTELFEFCWDELSRVQYPNGAVPSAYGEGNSLLWDYVAWYVIAFHDCLMYCSSTGFVIKHKENIYRAVDFLSSLAGDDGLIDVPKNPLGDLWMVELNEYVGRDPYLNELYMRSVKTAEITAELASDGDMRQKYAAIARKIQKPLEELLKNKDLVKTFDTTMHTQIQYELAETELSRGLVQDMISRIRKYWCSMITSGSDCMHECTLLTGQHPRIDEPDADNPEYSYCHGWTAAANVLLPMGIAGIKPTEYGFKKVRIKPVTDIFESFKCAVPTPYGEIALKYEHNTLHYIIPDGVEAELVLKSGTERISGEGSAELFL